MFRSLLLIQLSLLISFGYQAQTKSSKVEVIWGPEFKTPGNSYHYVGKNKINIENNSHHDIIVSGSHLVYDLNTQNFIPTKHIKTSELTNINCEILSCLITSNNTIQLGDWIFHDWEDNNGSPSKQI